jgi:hypothetical protein
MNGIVDMMGHNEVEGEIEIRFGYADSIDCAWEIVSNASAVCTSGNSESTSSW